MEANRALVMERGRGLQIRHNKDDLVQAWGLAEMLWWPPKMLDGMDEGYTFVVLCILFIYCKFFKLKMLQT
jgi:hypothetical protein